ncbi:alpha-amylase family glycosyl hydrolase [Mitsuaria sp. GD03876]|uniref:alpha-amylase family glycosyl hydrolase n=1 Tax=Mitsuaria sp. GD03876 TaxID=2975399 RepID=UPI00244C4A29|nr:alpha-amylase family glycosyl hydrolase [Mitsuaria sp. GD03876]MDH0865981.1 alpha-amylase family glycosyl hydrolase [Mitsuaria sp. GD03876]
MTHRPTVAALLAVLSGTAALAAGRPADAASVAPTAAAARVAAPVDLSPVPEVRGRGTLPEGWQHGAFMEIFVRGFQDSDGDGIGDLRGVTQRLDYLKDLGIKGIWLMPITASADRDHGYATTDYRAIEPQYGTLADFDALIREAHRRGIGVVMDYVINHGAREHPLFRSAVSDPASPWRDWFVWTTEPLPALKDWDIWGKTPWYLPGEEVPEVAEGASAPPKPDAPAGTPRYFATFGPHMPDFDMRNPAVVKYHADNLRFWLNRGLDGYRLDAVPHLIENNAKDWNDQPESRALTGWFTRQIKRYPHRFVVCEATAEPKVYTRQDLCGSAFAFGLERAVIDAAKGGDGADEAVAQVARFFAESPLSMATMLSNHDIFAGKRPWDQFDGDEARYKLAAATYLLLPGTPFLYYGEEIGQAGVPGLPGDAPLRAPMSWTADAGGFSGGTPFRPISPNIATHNARAQAADPGSLLNFYKAMLALRNSQPAIARGRYEAPLAQGRVLSFQRVFQGQRVLVVINYGQQAADIALPGLPPKARLRVLHAASTAAATGGAVGTDRTVGAAAASAVPAKGASRGAAPVVDARGRLMLTVAPQSVQVFRLR